MPVMTLRRLKEILDRFPSLGIAVVGDFFLDKWLEIDRSLDEASLETGLTAYQVTAKRLYAGAGGTVLSNLSALELGRLHALGFVGDDGEGFELRRILQKLGVNIDSLAVSDKLMTPTYTKPVFRREGGAEETNRLDHKNTEPLPPDIEGRIIDSIWKILPEVDALIALDQITSPGLGVLTPRVREELAKAAAAYPQVVFFADSRAFSREFRNVMVKCNDKEALKLFYPQADAKADMETLGECLLRLAELTGRPGFITCGERGVLAPDEKGRPSLIPTVAQHGSIDIVGAGDACSSGMVGTLCAGGTAAEAAFVGNLVSSITIQVIGSTGTATRDQVLARYEAYYGEGGPG